MKYNFSIHSSLFIFTKKKIHIFKILFVNNKKPIIGMEKRLCKVIFVPITITLHTKKLLDFCFISEITITLFRLTVKFGKINVLKIGNIKSKFVQSHSAIQCTHNRYFDDHLHIHKHYHHITDEVTKQRDAYF